MSAGTGVTHSEHNPSASDPVHLLQIWIKPETKGIDPSYEQTAFDRNELKGRLRIVASRDSRDGAVKIHQDAELYASILGPNEFVRYDIRPDRNVWLQIARGSIELNGLEMRAGDGAAITQESALEIKGTADAEILLFDLP